MSIGFLENDTYVFEQVLAKNGTSASVSNEIDSIHDYENEGFDTFIMKPYTAIMVTVTALWQVSIIRLSPSIWGPKILLLPFNIHAIAGGNERIIHFENNDVNYIERIGGSTEDDHLIGNERQQILVGHLGSDTLEAANGRDDVYKFFNNFEVLDTVSEITGITGNLTTICGRSRNRCHCRGNFGRT